MDRINRDGFTLAARQYGRDGDAPTIVLSNSLGASHAMWEPQIALLETRYRVIAYDTRGHGVSDAPDGPYTFNDLVADVIAVLDHYNIKHSDYMGLSLGGMTGLGVALSHPGRIGKLVCCDARADAPEAFAKSWDDRIAAIEAGGMRAILGGTMDRWFTERFRTGEPDAMSRVETMFLETSVTGYKGCAEALKRLDYLKDLGGVSIPTLYIAGSEDFGAPPDVMRAMCAATPGGQFVEIPDAAHIANMDNPQAFNAAISGFLGLEEYRG